MREMLKKKKRWIFRYPKCTSSFSLCFENDKSDGYTNAYIADDINFRKFTSGYLMTFARKQFHNNQCCKNMNLVS